MEHIICKQIRSHLSRNSIISQHQHGFQRGLSCDTQLITVIHEWASTLNIHGQVDVLFLDFAKAFDTVPHERLLLKAKFYGISGKVNNWLRVLTGRRQRVVVNVHHDIESSADHDKLQEDLLQLEEWAATWQMNFAPSKCYTMSITLKCQPYSYTLCNTPLEGVTFQKYSGVYITNSLNWSKQAVEVKKKANKILGVLQRNLVSCCPVVKERAYLSLVRPVCEYGSVAWSPYSRKDINCIESVQRRVARFVCNDYRRISSVDSMISTWDGKT